MSMTEEQIDLSRRGLCAVAAVAASGAPVRLMAKSANAVPVGGAPGIGHIETRNLGQIRQVGAGELDVGYADIGPPDGPPVILLHGWPYDILAFDDAAPILVKAGYRVIIPYLRGFGRTVFRSPGIMRSGQQAVFAVDLIALMDALRLPHAVLAGFDWGARTANIVAALWPNRCKALVSVSGYLIGNQMNGELPLLPAAERAWWYQFYFATERGRAGYAANREAFARLIWETASPQWRFDDAVFSRSVGSLRNADHVAIVIDNYRWRLGLVAGAPRLESIEQQLAAGPPITVPTITMEGDANGAPHPEPAAYAAKFHGPVAHRLIVGGVGHNLPQEAPQAFADAIIAADHM